jgi:hypothetical protein
VSQPIERSVKIGDVSGQVVIGSGNFVSTSEKRSAVPSASATVGATQHTIVEMDVAGSGSRDDQLQLRMRDDLRGLTDRALAAQRQDASQIDQGDLGDGIRLIVPATISPGPFLTSFVPALERALREHRRTFHDIARLRLRVAIHAGLLQRDSSGWFGQPLVHCKRLIDAQRVRETLARALDADLVVVVSAEFYAAVVCHGHWLTPADFHQVDINEKETQTIAWVHVPGYPVPRS